ncbi:hypothetical protein Aperf_G00000093505 [Anoplocephala perfoliata]
MARQAIVIDNGAFECRAGFSSINEPMLRFRNIVMKSRSRTKETFVGATADDLDLTQFNPKSAFEQNVVTQLDVQEAVFDHIFSSLNITDSGVNSPIIMSEPLCCPQQCRSQLLFETYGTERLTYFVDGHAAYYYNFGSNPEDYNIDTVMISFGYHTTHLIPFANGAYIPSACRRVSVGGAHVSWYLRKLLSLKYPCHVDKITIAVAEDLVHRFGKVCENYREEMQRWKDEAYCQENTQIWSLPYSYETQRKAEELVERRQFQADRLREIHRKRALDKAKEEQVYSDDSDDSQSCTSEVKRGRRYDDSLEYADSEEATPPFSEVENGDEAVLRKLANLREQKASELLSSLAFPAAVQAQMTSALPNASQGLTDARLKRRQLAAIDLEARRGNDLCLWLSQINNTRQRISKQRTLRQSKLNLATELGLHNQDHPDDAKIGVTSAADRKQRKIEKIRAMTNELKSDRGGNSKRGNGRGGSGRKAIPRNVSSRSALSEMAPSSVGDEDTWADVDDEAAALESLDNFSEDAGTRVVDFIDIDDEKALSPQINCPLSPTSFHTSVNRGQSRSRPRDAFDRLEDEAANLSECERDQLAVLDSVRAAYDPEFIKETGTVGLKVDVSEYYKIRLTTEPIRSTEVLFERSLLGNSQVGVGECLSWVLRDSSKHLFGESGSADNLWVPRRLFLTGGPATLPGMSQRLRPELQQLLPWKEGGNPLDVVVAADPSLDAWKGAQIWTIAAAANGFNEFTTRQVYEECGFDYLAENIIGNRFYASFKDLLINPKFNPGRGRQPGGVTKSLKQEM